MLSCRGVKALRAAPVKRPAPGYAPQEKVVVAGYRPARYYLGDIFDDLVDHGDRIAVVRLKREYRGKIIADFRRVHRGAAVEDDSLFFHAFDTFDGGGGREVHLIRELLDMKKVRLLKY